MHSLTERKGTMRTKDVTIGEETYKIGKLSCGQVDEIIFSAFEIKENQTQIVAVVQGGKRAVRSRICPAIAASLNNATQGNAKWYLAGWENHRDAESLVFFDGGFEEMVKHRDAAQLVADQFLTPDDVFSDFGYEEMVKLYEEICILSGLRT
jgi:hypothetical protein